MPPPNAKTDDLRLVIKLMKMTTSQVDNEALMALRKANERISALGWDWEALLSNKITIVADPFDKIEIIKPTESHRQPSAPPRPQAPQRPSAQSQYQQAYRAAQQAYQPRATPTPKAPTVNSYKSNRHDGNCFCCGALVNAWQGATFQPSNYNPSATSATEIICNSCNSSVNLHVPTKRAKRKGLSLSDLDL